MMELLASPEAWVALLTLTALEIVLGIDNVIFISVIVSRIPEPQAKRARQIGLALALIFRILLLSVLVWLIGLTQPVVTVKDLAFSWRDIILIGGGMFLIAKATHEIHGEVEAREGEDQEERKASAFSGRSCRSLLSTWCSRWIRSSPRSAWRRTSRSWSRRS
jgi:predicted tellurium resistance membrane protein TerC